MNVTKAVITVGGWGTRMLPITKSIEKCMLPVGTRPVIDYIVQDCVEAGIKDIYFVVGEQSAQLQSYYRSNIQLNDYLRAKGKLDKLDLIKPLLGVNTHFIVQSSGGKYGTAVPVGLVAPYIENDESALVIMGDDFIYAPGETGQIGKLFNRFSDDGGDGSEGGEGVAMFGVSIPREDVSRYGVLELDENGHYKSIVEKPNLEDAPSNLINIGRYLLPKKLFEAAAVVEANPIRGEYEITDVINQFVATGGRVAVVEPTGQYLDCGNPEGWLHANNVVASF